MRDLLHLSWGDDEGFVTVHRLREGWHSCDGLTGCHPEPVVNNIESFMFQAHHHDAVTQVQWWNELGVIVTCGKDGTLR